MSRQERDEFQRGRESMHSEVEALRAQIPSWRPIAEAPKDGSVVWTECGFVAWWPGTHTDPGGWVNCNKRGDLFDNDWGYYFASPRYYLTGVPPVPEG